MLAFTDAYLKSGRPSSLPDQYLLQSSALVTRIDYP